MKDLGALGGGSNSSYARGINGAGQVVGYASTIAHGPEHAFLYENGQMKDLGTLGDDSNSSYANDINDSGQVVGTSATGIGSPHAFLYENGQMTDLNSLIPAGSGWLIESAQGINNDGQIVVSGSKDGVGTHALLLTPQPPEEQIQTLKDDLNAVALPSGTNTSLQAKLNDALNALQADDTTTACTALSDFINQVKAQAGKKKISQTDADSLIAAAERIMTSIGCQ